MCDLRFLATASGVPWATIRPPAVPALGAEVNDPIGFGHQLQIVLDDDDGVARIHQALQHLDQPRDVRHVQANGRLLQQEEARSGGRSRPAGPKPVNKCVTSFSRCASPPLKVGLGWPSLR